MRDPRGKASDAAATTRSFLAVLPALARYGIVVRLVTAVVVGPLFGLLTAGVIGSRGAITNSTLVTFLFSPLGLVFIAGLLIVGAWLVAAELSGAILVVGQRAAGAGEATVRSLVATGFARLPNLLGVGLIPVALYLVVALPLTGLGFGLGALSSVSVPRFIMASIAETPSWLVGYLALMLLLLAAAALLIYTLPLIVLGDVRASRAVAASVRWVTRKPGLLVRHYVLPMTLAGLLAGVIALAWAGLGGAAGHAGWPTPVLAFLFLTQQVGVLVGGLLLGAFNAHRLVVIYRLAAQESAEASFLTAPHGLITRTTPPWTERSLRRPLITGVVAVALLAGASWPTAELAEEMATLNGAVAVIGHRAGGSAAPENSMAGLAYAVAHGASEVEIDVQRTADGHYVLNHDDTFARLTGEPRASSELTLAEIKRLKLPNGEAPPELGEFLDAAKGKAKVLLEMKGATADARMVTDVTALVEAHGMRASVTLMSLNYKLIQDAAATPGHLDLGYCYFLSVGDVVGLTGDVIILEQGEATPFRIAALRLSGKRVYVWTVDDEVAIRRFSSLAINGLITNEIDLARQVIDGLAKPSGSSLLTSLLSDLD